MLRCGVWRLQWTKFSSQSHSLMVLVWVGAIDPWVKVVFPITQNGNRKTIIQWGE